MDVISIWQPYASLAVHGFKRIETRPFPAPARMIGQRFGIASTKVIKPEQITAFNDERFAVYYAQTGLGSLDDLPNGYLLGTVLLHSCDVIRTQDDIDDLTEEEQLYGWHEIGRFQWRLRDPEVFTKPIPVRGKQGIWRWTDNDNKVRYLRPVS